MKDWNNVPNKKLVKILLYNGLIESIEEGQKMKRIELLKLVKINKVRAW